MYYPGIRQSWGIVGISILFMVLFSPVTILLQGIAGKEVAFLIYYVLAMGATFSVAHLKRKRCVSVSPYSYDLSSARIIILVSVAVIAIQTGIIFPAVNAVPMPEFMKNVFLEFAGQNGVFSFITIVIAAPILEELIFRGIILDGLLKRYSPLRSILMSSILFGVVHLNPWQFISAFIIGVFSGWVYYKTRKLTLSILIHFVNNLMAFASMYFADAEAMMNMSLTEAYGGFLNMIAITFGAIVVAVICLHFLRLEIQKMKLTVAANDHVYNRPGVE